MSGWWNTILLGCHWLPSPSVHTLQWDYAGQEKTVLFLLWWSKSCIDSIWFHAQITEWLPCVPNNIWSLPLFRALSTGKTNLKMMEMKIYFLSFIRSRNLSIAQWMPMNFQHIVCCCISLYHVLLAAVNIMHQDLSRWIFMMDLM